jgi:hypothetical protein
MRRQLIRLTVEIGIQCLSMWVPILWPPQWELDIAICDFGFGSPI